MKRFPAGRLGDAPSIGLSASLKSARFKLGRLQTGTPARLDKGTIDFSKMATQAGDADPIPFSYLNETVDNRASNICTWRTIHLNLIWDTGQPGRLLSNCHDSFNSSNSEG